MGPRHSFWSVLGPAEAPKFTRRPAGLANGADRGAAPSGHSAKIGELIGILGEANRIAGRCEVLFGKLRRDSGLSGIEVLTLIAIAHADKPPTVPQVGRSLGHPRQVIQRAVRELEQAGLVRSEPNPGHKRAGLLVATAAGRDLGRSIDAATEEIVSVLAEDLDLGRMAEAHAGLLLLRERIDAHMNDHTNDCG